MKLWKLICLWSLSASLTMACGSPEDSASSAASDRDGASIQQTETKSNVARWEISYVVDAFSSPPSRSQIYLPLMADRVVPFTTVPVVDYRRNSGAGGGTHVIGRNLGPGEKVGASGLGPCVGAVVSSPDNKRHWAFHFTATDSVKGTLNQYRFPRNSRVMIFGGSDEAASRITLASVASYFSADWYVKQGYHDVSGLWVDQNGTYFVHETELRSHDR